MITISKEVEFDAGHRVPGHASKCKNPHGHRYRVRVTCQGWIVDEPGAPDEGMLVDFGDLKTLMNHRVHDVLDHGFIVHADDAHMRQALVIGGQADWKVVIFPTVPTAENIARWIFDQLDEPISERFREGLRLQRVEVWETPTSLAVVDRDPEPGPITVNLNASYVDDRDYEDDAPQKSPDPAEAPKDPLGFTAEQMQAAWRYMRDRYGNSLHQQVADRFLSTVDRVLSREWGDS